jgi:hypothetical protein
MLRPKLIARYSSDEDVVVGDRNPPDKHRHHDDHSGEREEGKLVPVDEPARECEPSPPRDCPCDRCRVLDSREGLGHPGHAAATVTDVPASAREQR